MFLGKRVAVLVPAHNCAAEVGRLLPALPRALLDDILIMDDASLDGTGDVAEALGAHVVRKQRQEGLGRALADGLSLLCAAAIDIAVVCRPVPEDAGQVWPLASRMLQSELDVAACGLPLPRPLGWLRISLRWAWPAGSGAAAPQAYRTAVLSDPRIRLHGRRSRHRLDRHLPLRLAALGYRWQIVPRAEGEGR